MASFLRRFSKPEVIRSVHPRHLLALLNQFGDYLRSRGLALPTATASPTVDVQALVDILMSPDDQTPKDLIEALYLIDEMATDEGMAALIDECQMEGLALAPGDDHSAADIAIQVWLLNPNLVEKKHAEQYMVRPRSFEYFRMRGQEVPDFKLPSDAKLRALAQDLDEWFEKHKRGRNSRVFAYPREDSVWFLVRHGEPLRREASIENGESSSIVYRPEGLDVLVYEQTIGELRMNIDLMGLKDCYRKAFGRHLLGNEEFFCDSGKYTLEPLRADGEDSLRCDDIEGMESVRLTEIDYYWPGSPPETVTHKSQDLFVVLRNRGAKMPERPQIVKAGFEVKFTHSKRPRKITVRSKRVNYRRDDDSVLIERWLSLRGFVKKQKVEHAPALEEVEEVLVSH